MVKLALSISLVLLISITGAAQTQPKCPTITVTGPAGVVAPGERMEFSASVVGEVPKGVRYSWRITDGRVVNGQGTLTVQGKYNLPYTGRVTATITATGFPAGCPSTASEHLALAIDPGPERLATISGTGFAIGTRLLRKLGDVMKAHPNSQLYVWVYCRNDRFIEVKGRLVRHLANAGIEISRITFDQSEDLKPKAVFWLIGPGVENPAP